MSRSVRIAFLALIAALAVGWVQLRAHVAALEQPSHRGLRPQPERAELLGPRIVAVSHRCQSPAAQVSR